MSAVRRARFADDDARETPRRVSGQSQLFETETGLPLSEYSSLPPDCQPSFQEMFERDQGLAACFFLADVQKANSKLRMQRRVVCLMRDALFVCTPRAEVLRCVKILEIGELFRCGEHIAIRVPDQKYDLMFCVSHHNRHDASMLSEYFETAVSRLHSLWSQGSVPALTVHADQEWLDRSTQQHRDSVRAFLRLKRPAGLTTLRPLPIPLIPWRDLVLRDGFDSVLQRLQPSRRERVIEIRAEAEMDAARWQGMDWARQGSAADVEAQSSAAYTPPEREEESGGAALLSVRQPAPAARAEGLFDMFAAAAAAAAPVDADAVALSALLPAAPQLQYGPHDVGGRHGPPGTATQSPPPPASARPLPEPVKHGTGARQLPPPPPTSPPPLSPPPAAVTPTCGRVVYSHCAQSGYLPPPVQPQRPRPLPSPAPSVSALLSPALTAPLPSPSVAAPRHQSPRRSPAHSVEADIAALQASIDYLRQRGAGQLAPALRRALEHGRSLDPSQLVEVAHSLAGEAAEQFRTPPAPASFYSEAVSGIRTVSPDRPEPLPPPSVAPPPAQRGSAGHACEVAESPLAGLLAASLREQPGGKASAAVMAKALLSAVHSPGSGGDTARGALSNLLRATAELVEGRSVEQQRQRWKAKVSPQTGVDHPSVAVDKEDAVTAACARIDTLLAQSGTPCSPTPQQRERGSPTAGHSSASPTPSPAPRGRWADSTGRLEPSHESPPSGGLSKYQRLLRSSMRGFSDMSPRRGHSRSTPRPSLPPPTSQSPTARVGSRSRSRSRRAAEGRRPVTNTDADPLTAALRSSEFRSLRAAAFAVPSRRV